VPAAEIDPKKKKKEKKEKRERVKEIENTGPRESE
jgi:hypothetical protein